MGIAKLCKNNTAALQAVIMREACCLCIQQVNEKEEGSEQVAKRPVPSRLYRLHVHDSNVSSIKNRVCP